MFATISVLLLECHMHISPETVLQDQMFCEIFTRVNLFEFIPLAKS